MKLISREKILSFVEPFVEVQPTGIDISDLTLKYLKIGDAGLECFGEISIPEGVVVGGEIKNEPQMIEALRPWVTREAKKLGISRVAVSLPEEKSFLRLIQLPKIKREDVAAAIRWEIEANIPLPLGELIYDFEIVPSPIPTEDHFDVMISAFPKAVVESYVRVLKAVGLKPYVMELESQAVARAVSPCFGGNGAKIIVDIGKNRTGLIIYSDNAIVYTTTVAFGGKIIEDNIAKELKVSKEDALVLKKDIGIDRSAREGKLFLALLPSLLALADELKRTIAYFQTHPRHVRTGVDVDEVILVGGDANLSGLPTYLSAALRIPVDVADFLPVLSNSGKFPPILHEQSLSYATAIGLASRKFR